MQEYLVDQINQHKDLKDIFFKKYMKAQKIQLKNRYYIDYRMHALAADVLDKALTVLTFKEAK